MKRMLALLAVLMMTMCPVLAEETKVQEQANAAYAKVLTEGAEAILLHDEFLAADNAAGQLYRLNGTPARMTVMDMDTYGLMEVVLEMAEQEGYVILTFHDGRVYAAEIPYRGLLNLKGDGTHTYSSGALDSGVRMLLMENDWLTSGVLGESRSEGDAVIYIVGGTEVDEAAYQAFLEEQEAKLPALWYDYSADNVKMLLGL